MTRAEHELMINLTLAVMHLAAPDDQKMLERSLNALEAEGRRVEETRAHNRKHPLPVTFE